mgnify:CR=1 FL=1
MKKTILLFCALILVIKLRAQTVSGDTALTLKNLYQEIVKDSIKLLFKRFTHIVCLKM